MNTTADTNIHEKAQARMRYVHNLIQKVFPKWLRSPHTTKVDNADLSLLVKFRTMYLSRRTANMVPLTCCGVKELTMVGGINSPADYLDALCLRQSPGSACAYFIFTQATSPANMDADKDKSNYGWQLATYINANNLGDIVSVVGPDVNPNSCNYVTMFTWRPNEPALKKWFLERHSPEVGNLLYGKDCLYA